MFFPWAIKWGAIAGLATSIPFIFWIGIGAAIVKPPHTKALMSYTNCNLTAFDNATVAAIFDNSTTPAPEQTWDYPLYTLSYFWYSAVAVLVVLVVGMVVSLLSGPTDPRDLDPRCICPLVDHVMPFCLLPESVRKPFRFGIDHVGKNDASRRPMVGRKTGGVVAGTGPESVKLVEVNT